MIQLPNTEPYVSACARVRWTRVARGCALSPLASALVFSRRLLVRPCRLFVSKKTVLPKKKASRVLLKGQRPGLVLVRNLVNVLWVAQMQLPYFGSRYTTRT